MLSLYLYIYIYIGILLCIQTKSSPCNYFIDIYKAVSAMLLSTWGSKYAHRLKPARNRTPRHPRAASSDARSPGPGLPPPSQPAPTPPAATAGLQRQASQRAQVATGLREGIMLSVPLLPLSYKLSPKAHSALNINQPPTLPTLNP